jgi:hypothetical protein
LFLCDSDVLVPDPLAFAVAEAPPLVTMVAARVVVAEAVPVVRGATLSVIIPLTALLAVTTFWKIYNPRISRDDTCSVFDAVLIGATTLAKALSPLGSNTEVTSDANNEHADLNPAAGPKLSPSIGIPPSPLTLQPAHAA